jgi:ParB family chromosome partitioning protein
MNASQLINQDSGNTEYYTPTSIIEMARLCMGSIDLDPASSAAANERVRATRYFSVEDNGLEQEWHGNIWLNHPFSRQNNKLWVSKLVAEYQSNHVLQACCITFAATSERWFRPLLERPQCFISGRTNYYLPDGSIKKGVTKGSVVTYFGPNIAQFYESFRHLGIIKAQL